MQNHAILCDGFPSEVSHHVKFDTFSFPLTTEVYTFRTVWCLMQELLSSAILYAATASATTFFEETCEHFTHSRGQTWTYTVFSIFYIQYRLGTRIMQQTCRRSQARRTIKELAPIFHVEASVLAQRQAQCATLLESCADSSCCEGFSCTDTMLPLLGSVCTLSTSGTGDICIDLGQPSTILGIVGTCDLAI
ncbi:hypothetical protein LENED_008665 [Lentinula edodes]|uniref:Uncharacterized protein n=1 Tax=Lentinula edodes TaxID=5353 RepID=A0A1Q3EHQ5_LENED|nr:hypothetical protein LENED_008665 [Lentinula edodes]